MVSGAYRGCADSTSHNKEVSGLLKNQRIHSHKVLRAPTEAVLEKHMNNFGFLGKILVKNQLLKLKVNVVKDIIITTTKRTRNLLLMAECE